MNKRKKKKQQKQQQEASAVQLDEILKSLFSMSKGVMVTMLQSLFNHPIGENCQLAEIEIEYNNKEFTKYDYTQVLADMMLKVSADKQQKECYHIEFQTKNDSTMAIRMFEYGFNMARDEAKYGIGADNTPVKRIVMPRQLVIFVEENSNIDNFVELLIDFPENQHVSYKVNTFKLWEYSRQDLIDRKLYSLLPIKIFNLRYELDKINEKLNQLKDDKKDDIELLRAKLDEAVENVKILAQEISYQSETLFIGKEINGEDFQRMLLAIGNLCEYLDNRYMLSKPIAKEVRKMTQTLYNPEVERRGIEKGKEEGLKLAISMLRDTGISKEKIVEKLLATWDMTYDKAVEKVNLYY